MTDIITMFCWETVKDFGIWAGNAVECCGSLEDNAESGTDVEVTGESQEEAGTLGLFM